VPGVSIALQIGAKLDARLANSTVYFQEELEHTTQRKPFGSSDLGLDLADFRKSASSLHR
jgi:hypothetical protein